MIIYLITGFVILSIFMIQMIPSSEAEDASSVLLGGLVLALFIASLIWFMHNEDKDASQFKPPVQVINDETKTQINNEPKTQQEKILNLCKQNPVTKMYEDKGTKYVVINNGVYAVTGEYWGYYSLNEKCK